MIILFFIIFILLPAYYAYFLIRILNGLGNLSQPSKNDSYNDFVSVIIPFRNEARNISNSLASIEKLEYPEDKFEIIYVDDNSTDDSCELIESGKNKANVRILRLPYRNSSTANKKRALQYGIENSRGEIIVTTDADCIHHKNWLKNLVNCFDDKTAFVSAPVEFNHTSNLFSKLQKIEFEGLVLAGAGLIGSGKPVICNGANIAYKKSAYLKTGGLLDSIDISSGDDAFLMQKMSGFPDYKVKFCGIREAVVLTDTNSDFKEFFNQRKRWAGKSLNYKDKNLILQLILIFLFYCGIILQFLLLITGYYIFLITLALSFIIKTGIEYLIIKKGEGLFFPKNKISDFLVTEFLHIPYIVITTIAGLAGHFTWKGRKIRL